MSRPSSRPGALLAAAEPRQRLRRVLPTTPAAATARSQVVGGVLPAAVRRRAGRRRPRRRRQPHRSRAASRTTSSSRQADRRGRRGRPGRLRAAASSRRSTRPSSDDARSTSSTPPTAWSTLATAEEADDGARRPTRTSGWTRSCWPTSATRSPTELAELDPDHADDYAAPTRRACSADLEALDAEYRAGLADCEHRHRRGQPRRVRLPRPLRPGVRGHRRALPDAEPTPADLGRARRPDRRRRHHHRLHRALASPELADTLADDLGLATAVLDPIEGLTDETDGRGLPVA